MQQDNFDKIVEWYDMCMGENIGEKDIAMYKKVLKNVKGDLLEVACGNGRVLIPLSKDSECWGFDNSQKMLDKLIQKVPELESRVSNQDMFTFGFDKEFDVIICAFSIFTHLLTKDDQESFLENVRNHLTIGGMFIVDIFNPKDTSLGLFDSREFSDGTILLRESKWETVSKINQVNQVTKYYTIHKDLKKIKGLSFVETIRYTYYWEMVHLLEKNGFIIEEQYGDYDMNEINDNSPQLIFVCKKK